MAALVLGVVLVAAPKGRLPHWALRWIWVALMGIVALGSFWIRLIRLVGPFSPIHLLSIFVLMVLPPGCGGPIATRLPITGSFTLLPGADHARRAVRLVTHRIAVPGAVL